MLCWTLVATIGLTCSSRSSTVAMVKLRRPVEGCVWDDGVSYNTGCLQELRWMKRSVVVSMGHLASADLVFATQRIEVKLRVKSSYTVLRADDAGDAVRRASWPTSGALR